MKVMTIVGARPQFVKAGPVSDALQKVGIDEILVHTGQHYDHGLSEVFFEELGLRIPEVNIHAGSGSHAEQTAKMLVGIEHALVDHRPDWALVYGDTNSTLAGALAAAKLHVPVAHVEAGLRSFNRRMPEELNRIIADQVSRLLFAPTRTAADNLRREGVAEEHIRLVGDVMYDVALLHSERARRDSSILSSLGLRCGEYILVTAHRAENTDERARLKAIVDGLIDVAPHSVVVWPLHPRTRAALERHSLLPLAERWLKVVEPVGYLDMVMLEKSAKLIATDSGGVQKEAFFYRVPCVTLRDETEWVETVEMGWNRLAPPVSKENVVSGIMAAWDTHGEEGQPYGGGDAAGRIAEALQNA